MADGGFDVLQSHRSSLRTDWIVANSRSSAIPKYLMAVYSMGGRLAYVERELIQVNSGSPSI